MLCDKNLRNEYQTIQAAYRNLYEQTNAIGVEEKLDKSTCYKVFSELRNALTGNVSALEQVMADINKFSGNVITINDILEIIHNHDQRILDDRKSKAQK